MFGAIIAGIVIMHLIDSAIELAHASSPRPRPRPRPVEPLMEASALIAKGKLEAALRVLQKAERKAISADSRVLLKISDLCRRLGRTDEAVAALLRAAAGMDAERKISAYKQALELDARNAGIHVGLAQAYAMSGAFAEAALELEVALGLPLQPRLREAARTRLRQLDPLHPLVRTAVAPAQRHPELEASLQEDPDNADTYQVYADWLCSQGDPRGELIILQYQQATATTRVQQVRFNRDAERLLAAHRDALLGGLGTAVMDQWRFGFLERVRVTNFTSIRHVAQVIEVLTGLPSSVVLRDLIIEDARFLPTVARSLAQHRVPPTLRRLRLGVERRRAYAPTPRAASDGDTVDLSGLRPLLRRLDTLAVYGASVRFGRSPLSLPRLEQLELSVDSPVLLHELDTLKLPALQSVRLVASADATFGALAPILASPALSGIAHLSVALPSHPIGLWTAVAHSRLASQIEQLDIAGSEVSAQCVSALLGPGTRLSSLKSITGAWHATDADAAERMASLPGVHVEPAVYIRSDA